MASESPIDDQIEPYLPLELGSMMTDDLSKPSRFRSMLLLLTVLIGLGCRAELQEEVSPSPDKAVQPAASPQIFAEGVVSSVLPEFATTFSPDGNTVYFNRTPADRSAIQIWTSTLANGEWTEPSPLPFSDGTYRDLDPFMAADGQRLFFSSNRPVEGSEPSNFDLWYVEQADEGWSKPINLGGPVNTENNEIFCTLSRNGNLYFSVFEVGGDGGEIFRSSWSQGKFLAPERLVIETNGLHLTNPAIAPDESFLVLSAVSGDQADLYLSRRRDDGWTKAVALGPEINSTFSEFAPYVSLDGTMLYFTSERPGVVPAGGVEGRPPGDLYVIPIAAALP